MLVLGVAILLPAFAAAQGSAAANADQVFATFTGQRQGVMCGMSSTKPSVALQAFDETTRPVAQSAAGNDVGKPPAQTFDVTLASVCAAPFFDALFNGEAINMQFTFVDGQTQTTTLTMSMPGARLAKVDLYFMRDSAGALPQVELGIFAPRVDVGGSAVTPAGSTNSSSGGGGGGGGGASRARALSVHPRIVRSAVMMAIPTAAMKWMSGGLAGTNVQLAAATPSLNATFLIKDLHLAAIAALDAGSGMPTGAVRATLAPFTKPVDSKTSQIKAVLTANAVLTQSVLSVVNMTGSAGITVTLRYARVLADQVTASTETVSLGAPEIRITDIASGRTATATIRVSQ